MMITEKTIYRSFANCDAQGAPEGQHLSARLAGSLASRQRLSIATQWWWRADL